MKVHRNPLFLCVILALVTLVFQGNPVEARVKVKTRVVYYDISGSNGVELAMSMIKRGPRAAGLQHAIASTKPDIKFGEPVGMQNSRYCKVKDVDIRVTLVYTYPRWRNQKKASAQLRQAWKKLYNELVRHEETHGRIVIETANQIYREILRDKGTVSRECKDFGKRLLRKMPRIMSRYEKRQIAFDRRESWGVSRVSRLQRRLLKIK